MWSNMSPARRLTREMSCAFDRGQHPHVRLLADEGERSKPTKRQPFTLQLGDRRTEAGRQVDRRRFIELWDVRLDQVRRRLSGGHRVTVGRRASAPHRGKPDNSLLLGERDRAVSNMTGELGARPYAQLSVDPSQMGFDSRDGREELRCDFPIGPSCRDEFRDLPFGIRKLAIAPRSRPRPPQLLLGSLHPQRSSQAGEDRRRRLELLGCPPTLTRAAKRVTGDEQCATTVERETGRLEGIGRLLALRRRFDGVFACEQAQCPRPSALPAQPSDGRAALRPRASPPVRRRPRVGRVRRAPRLHRQALLTTSRPSPGRCSCDVA